MMTCALLINACNFFAHSNVKTPNTVPENASYYYGHFLVLADEYMSDDKYSYADVTPKYFGDSYIAVLIQTERVDGNDSIFKQIIELYDYEGELIQQTDLYELEPGKIFSEICMGKTNKGICLLLVDERTSYSALYSVDFELMEWDKVFDIPLSGFKRGFSPDSVFENGEEFIVLYNWLDGSCYKSSVAMIDSAGGIIHDWEIDSISSVYNANLYNNSLVYQDDHKGYCCMDLNTGRSQIIEMDENISELYKLLGKVEENGKIYIKNGNEIRAYDITDKSETVVQDLNYSDCNVFSLYKGYLAYVGSQKTVLLDLRSSRNEKPGRCKMLVLDKSEKNPYSGRKIMEIAMIWGITSVVGEAQQLYNQSNKEYFSYVSTRYDVRYFKLPDYYQSDPTLTELVTLVTDQITVDIRNGNGPDIIVGLGDSTRLNSEEFLLDLYPYIDGQNGIIREDYFENAFEAFSVNNRLYQMPLSINVLGILTDTSNVPVGRKGFSFDEYTLFVDEVCNGIDPISIGNNREQYFRFLFCSMHNRFITPNSIDVDNKDFRDLVEYTKYKVTENGYQSEIEPSGAEWVVFSNFYSDVLSSKLSEPTWDLYGPPSCDDRGPMITNFNTISITTCASDFIAGWLFVKTTISYEAQIAQKGDNPINRNAFRDYALTALEDAKVTLKDRHSSRKLDHNDIDRYVRLLEKADCVSAYDTELYKVIFEELQPYYADEKEIDGVISIITDRCQTIIDER